MMHNSLKPRPYVYICRVVESNDPSRIGRETHYITREILFKGQLIENKNGSLLEVIRG